MKFKEWYNFVFCNENVNSNWGDMYVKVFRKVSYDYKNMCFTALLTPSDAVKMFGDYVIFSTTNHTDNDYKTICVLLCIPEEEKEDK